MNSLAKKLAVEFIGSFFLIFTIGTASGNLAPFAIAGVLAAMIFAGGRVSGAHYNPAVTVSVWIGGGMPAREVAPYIVSQTAAAGAAGLAAVTGAGRADSPAVFDTGTLLIAEILFTFALCFVILNVTASENSFYGAAIGLVVLAGIISVGSLSGAVFNPAVAVGLFVKGAADAPGVLLYTIANLTGGAVAAFVFRFVSENSAREP